MKVGRLTASQLAEVCSAFTYKLTYPAACRQFNHLMNTSGLLATTATCSERQLVDSDNKCMLEVVARGRSTNLARLLGLEGSLVLLWGGWLVLSSCGFLAGLGGRKKLNNQINRSNSFQC